MTTLHDIYPIARCAHRCSGCGNTILQGERYHRWKGASDLWPGIALSKECAQCYERYGRLIPKESN
jgi:hypothetical protein